MKFLQICARVRAPGALVRFSSMGIAFVIGSLLGSTSLLAREKNDLDISLTASRVELVAGGEEKLVKANAAFPGDVIEYKSVYFNQGQQPLRSLTPTLPVPVGMEYLPGSAYPAPVAASLDGKRFEPIPLRRSRKLADGREVSVEVPASAYRAIRWAAGDLPAGSRFTLSTRVRVLGGNVALAR